MLTAENVLIHGPVGVRHRGVRCLYQFDRFVPIGFVAGLDLEDFNFEVTDADKAAGLVEALVRAVNPGALVRGVEEIAVSDFRAIDRRGEGGIFLVVQSIFFHLCERIVTGKVQRAMFAAQRIHGDVVLGRFRVAHGLHESAFAPIVC